MPSNSVFSFSVTDMIIYFVTGLKSSKTTLCRLRYQNQPVMIPPYCLSWISPVVTYGFKKAAAHLLFWHVLIRASSKIKPQDQTTTLCYSVTLKLPQAAAVDSESRTLQNALSDDTVPVRYAKHSQGQLQLQKDRNWFCANHLWTYSVAVNQLDSQLGNDN